MDYDAYKHLCILTVLSSLAPLRLMLADTSKPRGCDATLASVGTLSEGFERFVTAPLYLVGYVRWDARSDRCSFSSFRQSLQQLSGRNCPIHRSLCCGREQALTFRTNVDEMVTAGPEHPIRIAHDILTCEPTPYLLVRPGLGRLPIEARICRAVYYELAALAEPGLVHGRRMLGVWSDGKFFSLGELPPGEA